MSIIPASRLSSSDLMLLGNNIRRAARRAKPRSNDRRIVAAVNRSLARLGEQVTCLHSPVAVAS